MQKVFFSMKSYAVLLFLFAVTITGCSEQDINNQQDMGINVSNFTPIDVTPTAKHESIAIQYNKVAGIGGAGNDKCFPTYDVKISTENNVEKAEYLGNIPSSKSLLIRFYINKTKTNIENANVLEYKKLQDNQLYYIFIRSNYTNCGFGTSNWVSVSATPIPLPTKAENVKVIQGDKHLTITWDKKAGELYAVHINDCPSKPMQYNKWKPKNELNTDHYIVELEDNTKNYAEKICIVTTNANGFIDSNNKSTWQVLGKDILVKEKASLQGKAATKDPIKPVISEINGKNRRVELSFTTNVEGENSTSLYEYASSKDNFAKWNKVIFNQKTANIIIPELENNKTYQVKIRATNTKNSNGIESDIAKATPTYTPIDYNNNSQYLGTASAPYIYAEDVPHSDFWRISDNFNKGGRPDTDRLTRGKETAIGNLFADGIMWYAKTETQYKNIDFSWLIGDMITQGIQGNQPITVGLLKSIITSDYLEDTLVVVDILGSDLIKNEDYNINLESYPVVGNQDRISLFRQAASVYRNGHYGGSGGTVFNGKWWGIPSKEVKYTIEYKSYDLEAFKTNFEKKCASIDKNTGIDKDTNKLYDAKNDPKGCYLLKYEEAYPESGNPVENSVMGYKRGKIQNNTLLINSKPIEPTKTYKVLTTKKIADEMYVAFLGANYTNIVNKDGSNTTLLQAMAEYIAAQGIIEPYLDGRVKLVGGVPGNTKNDFTSNK